ncbi:hypothetical protein M5K25_000868 [Dendrobium thyrsiflorum]|uniref:Uncharacterized protein n=1 Tax=Dendrobium thyrsiflorum TaxID=117978 RepID=A0ABD0WDZ4_DENTH
MYPEVISGGDSSPKEFMDYAWAASSCSSCVVSVATSPPPPVSFGVRANREEPDKRSQVGGRPRSDRFSWAYVHPILIFGGESASVVKSDEADRRTWRKKPSRRPSKAYVHPILIFSGESASVVKPGEGDRRTWRRTTEGRSSRRTRSSSYRQTSKTIKKKQGEQYVACEYRE